MCGGADIGYDLDEIQDSQLFILVKCPKSGCKGLISMTPREVRVDFPDCPVGGNVQLRFDQGENICPECGDAGLQIDTKIINFSFSDQDYRSRAEHYEYP
jgi:hypothetical protein